MKTLLPNVLSFVKELNISEVSVEREQNLNKLISYLRKKKKNKESINLNFICTHNSRRSQLCQVWAQTFAHHFELENLRAYSGGTEATAFHPNAVHALRNSGFEISKQEKEKNPVYQVTYSEDGEPVECFSKLYHKALPEGETFAAILTCSDADANCPFIPEAEERFSIRYEDPKKADGTAKEQQTYAERNKEIATEMYYIFTKIRS